MSDLGFGGWPNSMKLGEDIDLDELLLNPVLFVFVLECRFLSRVEIGYKHF